MSLFDDYKKSLKLLEVEEILDLIFYRPLAFIFVKSILKTNITPNQVTLLSMGFGVLAGIMYIFGSYFAFILAGLFYIVYDVLDCSDGQLARIKKNGTPLGRVLDGVADYVVSIFAYIGIGIGFASHSGSPILYWSLIFLAALSNAVHSSTLDYYRNRFLDYALDRESLLGDNLKTYREEYDKLLDSKGKRLEKALLWIYFKYSYVQLKLSSSNIEIETKKYDPKDFYRKHKIIMHLWTYLGPTTELSFLIIASFINRLDLYLWGLVVVGNAYNLILYVVQKRINKGTKLIVQN